MRRITLTTALLVASTATMATGNHQLIPANLTGGFANAEICNEVVSSASVRGIGTASSFATGSGVAGAGITLSPNLISGSTTAIIDTSAGRTSTGNGYASSNSEGEASADAGATTKYTRPAYAQQSGKASSDAEAQTSNGSAGAGNESWFVGTNAVTPTSVYFADGKGSESDAYSTTRQGSAYASGSAIVSATGGIRIGISVPRVTCDNCK